MIALYIVLGGLGLALLWLVVAYNQLIAKCNRSQEGWADIDVQLKRRHDLIPNLVASVKGYMAHEKGVLERVTEARTKALGAQSEGDQMKAEGLLSQSLKTLFAVSENYPALRANENFLLLQDELSDTENKIQAARRFYNSQVRDLNIAIEEFPRNLLANRFGFKKMTLFNLEAEPALRENVKVEF